MEDWQLLREYVEHGSESAFARLVERHLGLVYTTCLREVRNPDLAQDVAQAVFLILARKASRIPRGTLLTGWLFNTARFASRNTLRHEARRRGREAAAGRQWAQEHPMEDREAEWSEVEPLLHEALASLRKADRDVLLLRYFQDCSLKEVAVATGTSEKAAHMRVARALEKLRSYFRHKGIQVSGAGLAGWLSVEVVPASAAEGLSPLWIAGVARGHVEEGGAAALRVYELTEGVIRAMRTIQLTKVALGVAATSLLGSGVAVTARALEAPAGEAPLPTAKELLARFAAHQDRIHSFIYKSEDTSQSLDPEEPRVRHSRNEFRADGKRQRFARRSSFWGSDTPEWSAEIPGYTSHLWNGSEYYNYTHSVPGRTDDLTINQEGLISKTEAEREIRMHAGAVYQGHFHYDPDRVDRLLSNARTLTVRPQRERVGEVECYVLEGDSAYGKYTLWLDPEHGYSLARAEAVKTKGHLVLGQALKQGAEIRQSCKTLKFARVDGVWIPMEGEAELRERFPLSALPRIPGRVHHKKTAFQLNPDFEALKSFTPDDVRDGTKVYVATPKRRFFPLGSTEGRYTWKNGKPEPLVPSS